MNHKKAVVLVSGGLDSATVLAIAKDQGYQCYALSFRYGQRHLSELEAAKRLCAKSCVTAHKIVDMDLGQIGGSALTDPGIEVPPAGTDGIPITYVPARNTLFLSFALGWAEVLNAQAIFIGANALDYSGYPDCRPEYLDAFQKMANLATKQALQGQYIQIEAPLIAMTKADIIRTGIELGVDYSITVSCYQANEQGDACGQCDSCRLRIKGFKEARVSDPTVYCPLVHA